MDTVHDMSLHIRNLAHRMSSSLHHQHQHMLHMIHLRGHSADLAYPKAEQVRNRIGQQLRQAARCQHLRTVRANRADEKEKPSNEEAHQQERKQDLVPAKVVQLRVLNAELQATIKKTLTTGGTSDEGSTAIITSKVQEINKYIVENTMPVQATPGEAPAAVQQSTMLDQKVEKHKPTHRAGKHCKKTSRASTSFSAM